MYVYGPGVRSNHLGNDTTKSPGYVAIHRASNPRPPPLRDTDTIGVGGARRSISPSSPRTAATSANGHPIDNEQHQIGNLSFHKRLTRKETTKRGGRSKRKSPAPSGGLTQQADSRPYHHHHHKTEAKEDEMGRRSCWDLEGNVQAYRSAAANTVRRLSSALFGEELLAIETAKTVAAEREKMLQTKARETCESQV